MIRQKADFHQRLYLPPAAWFGRFLGVVVSHQTAEFARRLFEVLQLNALGSSASRLRLTECRQIAFSSVRTLFSILQFCSLHKHTHTPTLQSHSFESVCSPHCHTHCQLVSLDNQPTVTELSSLHSSQKRFFYALICLQFYICFLTIVYISIVWLRFVNLLLNS